MKNIANTTLSNFMWRFFERCGAQGVNFIVSIILARLLEPSVYGTIAIVTVFITILQVFIDSGLGNALIQKKNADDLDFSTVFFFNVAACVVLYIMLYIAAPYVALYYDNQELTALLRVLGLTLIISSLKNVQQAFVSRKLIFRRFFFSTLGGTIGSAVIGIILAISGWGVWALVFQKIINVLVATVVLWFTVKWRPKLQFSFERLKGLLSYGWKILVAKLIDTIYNDIRQLIIGKEYTSVDLAYYNRGKQFPKLIVDNVDTSIDSVLLPIMASKQDNIQSVKNMTRRAIKTSTAIIAPLMLGLALCADTVVHLILAEKWMPCVPYLRIFCFTYFLRPIHAANLNAIKALGRSEIVLKLEIAKKVVGMVLLLASIKLGVMAMAYTLLLSGVINMFINIYPNIKLLKYGAFDQMKDIAPAICVALIAGGGAYLISFLALPDLVKVILQFVVGAVIYISISLICRLDGFCTMFKLVKEFLSKMIRKRE